LIFEGSQNMLVKIEQRLQDPARFLILPLDEAVFLGLPFMMGLLSRQIIVGSVVAFVVWSVWRRLKGEGGIERLLAAAYWYLPSEIGIFKPFPDSATSVWEA